MATVNMVVQKLDSRQNSVANVHCFPFYLLINGQNYESGKNDGRCK